MAIGGAVQPGAVPYALEGIQYTRLASPVGTLWIAMGAVGLVRVELGDDELAFAYGLEASRGVPAVRDDVALQDVAGQFEEYFVGRRRVFNLPVDLQGISRFQRSVLQAVQSVPYGSVASYGQIAKAVGHPRAARAVGAALSVNPIDIVVPCHRIIRADGSLGEYAMHRRKAEARAIKLELLTREGVTSWPASLMNSEG